MTEGVENPSASEGSIIQEVAPGISLACMNPDYRDAMNAAINAYCEFKMCSRDELDADRPDDGPSIYSFAYWLFRYSGRVIPVAASRP